MTDDLIAFIRARYDDEERAARRVLDLESDEFEYEYEWSRHSRHKVSGGSGRMSLPGASSPTDRLAEVDAKRRILDWLDSVDRIADAAEVFGIDVAEARRLLALPFAQHPEFRDEWRVNAWAAC